MTSLVKMCRVTLKKLKEIIFLNKYLFYLLLRFSIIILDIVILGFEYTYLYNERTQLVLKYKRNHKFSKYI